MNSAKLTGTTAPLAAPCGRPSSAPPVAHLSNSGWAHAAGRPCGAVDLQGCGPPPRPHERAQPVDVRVTACSRPPRRARAAAAWWAHRYRGGDHGDGPGPGCGRRAETEVWRERERAAWTAGAISRSPVHRASTHRRMFDDCTRLIAAKNRDLTVGLRQHAVRVHRRTGHRWHWVPGYCREGGR